MWELGLWDGPHHTSTAEVTEDPKIKIPCAVGGRGGSHPLSRTQTNCTIGVVYFPPLYSTVQVSLAVLPSLWPSECPVTHPGADFPDYLKEATSLTSYCLLCAQSRDCL